MIGDDVRSTIERIVTRSTGRDARVREATSLGGGCINAAHRVVLGDGQVVFAKSNVDAPPVMFEREVEGLAALASLDAIRVPRPLGSAVSERGVPVLVMEHIGSARAAPDFSARLGRGLAAMHARGRSERAGFAHDNFLGTTAQPNPWDDDWVRFFAEHRLGHQLALATRAGLLDASMQRLGERLVARLGELLGESAREPMCLLHGDLWGGNYLVGSQGEPVLVDPAAYYGHREAELSMTTLFGGFDAEFYAAYDEAWPLSTGWRERLEIYGLYHLLNHLNLFGRSYLGRCRAVLERFVGQRGA